MNILIKYTPFLSNLLRTAFASCCKNVHYEYFKYHFKYSMNILIKFTLFFIKFAAHSLIQAVSKQST